jgi:hypothetical protein
MRATLVGLIITLFSCGGGGAATATGPDLSLAELGTFDVGQGLHLPVYRSQRLDQADSAITQAIIVVHGSSRDASGVFHTVWSAAQQGGTASTTLVIAPHFLCDEDQRTPDELYFKCGGQDWTHGYRDQNNAASPIYSYAVIDSLVKQVTNPSLFPNLKHVVITGLSAGGQLTQRYAEFSDLDPLPGVDFQYVVLSPSSYAWLDSTRPGSTQGCAGYDDYYYGLENRSGYVGELPSDTIRSRYVGRAVSYFVGDQDTLANAEGTNMDTSCQANAQGADRIERANNFFEVMSTTYGASHPLTIVPGCPHSSTCMYFSPELRKTLQLSAPGQ